MTEEQKRVMSMNGFFIRVQLPDGDLKDILIELKEAQEKIRECYIKLGGLGLILTDEKEETPSE